MTGSSSGVSCAVLMCHAPIVVPEIAGSRAGLCARTSDAMARAAQRLCAHDPDVLVVISPHAPRDRTRFGVVEDASIAGTFAAFGWPEIGLELPGAPEAALALQEVAEAHGVGTRGARGDMLDHGALVPLYFVHAAGFRGPTLVLALPYPGTNSERAMGRAIAATAVRLGQRFCVLASGDMSHRLSPESPNGFHPQAHQFDARLRRADRSRRAGTRGGDRCRTARGRRRGRGRLVRGGGRQRRVRAARLRGARVRGAVRRRLSRSRAVRSARARVRATARARARRGRRRSAGTPARHRTRGDFGASARAALSRAALDGALGPVARGVRDAARARP